MKYVFVQRHIQAHMHSSHMHTQSWDKSWFEIWKQFVLRRTTTHQQATKYLDFIMWLKSSIIFYLLPIVYQSLVKHCRFKNKLTYQNIFSFEETELKITTLKFVQSKSLQNNKFNTWIKVFLILNSCPALHMNERYREYIMFNLILKQV